MYKQFKTGDIVEVNSPSSVNFGEIGVVIGSSPYGKTTVEISQTGKRLNFTSSNLNLINREEHSKPKEKDDFHVMLYRVSDDPSPVSFSGNMPSIRTMQDEFDLSCGDVFVGTMEDIKEDIKDSLSSWEYVYGLIDNKPFKATRDIVMEGVDV